MISIAHILTYIWCKFCQIRFNGLDPRAGGHTDIHKYIQTFLKTLRWVQGIPKWIFSLKTQNPFLVRSQYFPYTKVGYMWESQIVRVHRGCAERTWNCSVHLISLYDGRTSHSQLWLTQVLSITEYYGEHPMIRPLIKKYSNYSFYFLKSTFIILL